MKEKSKTPITSGIVYIKLSFVDTIVSIKDTNGNLLCSRSASSLGFSGSKKSSPGVVGKVASIVAGSAKELGLRKVSVIVKGSGVGRQAAIYALQKAGLEVDTIKDITPIPHNGCRPPKRKRS